MTFDPHDDARRRRWRVAAHEAAHATVAAGLGFPPRTAAVIGGEGWATFGRNRWGCYPDVLRMAAIAAAGSLGERLAAAVNPPVRERRRIGIEATKAMHTESLDKIEADAIVTEVDNGAHDNELVAKYSFMVGDWSLWSDRARHVHTMAQQILDAHPELHRGIAEALFLAGFLGQDELENLVRVHAPQLMEDSSNDDLR